ncbi:hypothetical protein SAMN02746089_00784 [Caldanaerobius fijiensis DSM 17918]|uniref:RNA methylase family UPF0020 n=1 Tax=Caldanaerobius fijiensis DSM 17918 TaxID=1121256 RepID=A0A1M4W7M9_9THEO|nr:hypothetical protein [Caldanaerobius fijiensis]SHE77268.1 hypothetical protein SAMN02746089_00784 [Caldanaerobius fijiensis DSM 17918]
MEKYLILMHPYHNQVYYNTSKKLALLEFEAAAYRMSRTCENIALENIHGIDYVTFNVDSLPSQDLKLISRLSFVYALFKQEEYGGKTCLVPMTKDYGQYLEDDIVNILKYSGKTNEYFTKLMINLAVFASDFYGQDRINLLDPVCGKGTSLFQGLIFGYNVSGVEIDKKLVDQGLAFLIKYLENKRFKHKVSKSKMSSEGTKICDITCINLAKTKEEYKNNNMLEVNMVRGDTVNTDKYFKKNYFHVIVADLPYGIQHGSNTGTGSFTRNPELLLQKALPAWTSVLKKGGSLVLSWNTFLLKRQNLHQLLEQAGLAVLEKETYNQFEHRVDQAIMRDIIVARKN